MRNLLLGVFMAVTGIVSLPAPSAGAAAADPALRPLEMHFPVYAQAARRARLGGSVTIKVVISPDGSVASARIFKSDFAAQGIAALDDASSAAAKLWRFRPIADGQRRTMDLVFEFVLVDTNETEIDDVPPPVAFPPNKVRTYGSVQVSDEWSRKGQ